MRQTVIHLGVIVAVSLVAGGVYALVLKWRESPNHLAFTVDERLYPDALTCDYQEPGRGSPSGTADGAGIGVGARTAAAVAPPTTDGEAASAPQRSPPGAVVDPGPIRVDAPDAPDAPDGLPKILVDEAYEFWQEGALFVDARRTKSYVEGHISGAVSISAWESTRTSRIEALAENTAREESIVVYCTKDPNCPDSKMIAGDLKSMEFLDVRVFLGGYPSWLEKGHPVVKGEEAGVRPGVEE